MQKPIDVKIDDKEFKEYLKKISQKVKNMRPLMKEIAGQMMHSVEENFKKERGKKDWDGLAEATKKQRAAKKKWPGKILQRSRGGLASSISKKITSNSAIVGTNKIYAAIHQFGGEISIPEHKQVIHFKTFKGGKKKGKTFFSKSKKATHGMKVNVKAHNIKIPARPFLELRDSHLKKIAKIVKNHFKNLK